MKIVPMIAALLLASPVFGQSRVYTNADLGKPLQQAFTITPEQLRTLAANQFALPPTYPGPQLFIYNPGRWWPFDGPQAPIVHPREWRVTTYVGRVTSSSRPARLRR